MSALNEWLYRIDLSDPSRRGTATCLNKIVTYQLLLNYTLNMEKRLQLYL
jgi:hypothetical protein